MMQFTVYDTISGKNILEHASEDDVIEKLEISKETFWRNIDNENYLCKGRYEIIAETKTYKGSIVMTIEEKTAFVDGWITACRRLADYAGIKVGWLME